MAQGVSRYLNIYTILLVLLLLACNPESQPINYGADMCEFCRMSIVDQRFGSEIVTQKGKVYKFDAVECMINYLDDRVEDESKLKYILTNTLDAPGELVDVQKCTFLKSKNMPSPMGMFINPFRDSTLAIRNQEENSGTILDWANLRGEFKK
jgi:copper chaperone NosL